MRNSPTTRIRSITARRLPLAIALLSAVVLACGCCPHRVGPTPAFASRPFAPFSRAAAVAIALREWRLFGQPYDDRSRCLGTPAPSEDKPERQEGLWQRVGEYHWIGLGGGHPHRGWTGKHDDHGCVCPPEDAGTYAWSAAFISYVRRIAGARDLFLYDDAHSTFINEAARVARGEGGVGGATAERPECYAPRRGDLICAGRDAAASIRFDDLPAGTFPAHCSIVVDVQPDALYVVGGNVADAVTLTRVPVAPGGLLMRPDGTSTDPCVTWFVVLAIRYEE